MQQDIKDYLPTYRRTRGWFAFSDLLVFDALLDAQAEIGTSGDLLEIGVMHGKSAFFLGRKRLKKEQLLLCDLFESRPDDSANADENIASYAGVTRAAFDQAAAGQDLGEARVLQMASGLLSDHVANRSLRFAHVDGGHLYPQVEGDVDLMDRLLVARDGWVAFDDYRTAHAPGVAAAVWAALARGPLEPVLLTSTKLYAALNPDPETKRLLRRHLEDYGLKLEEQKLFDSTVLRVVEPLEISPYRRPRAWRGQQVIKFRQSSSLAGRFESLARRFGAMWAGRR